MGVNPAASYNPAVFSAYPAAAVNIDFKLLDLFDQMFELGVDLLKLDDLAAMKSRFSLSS